MNIELPDNAVIELEGVKVSAFILRENLRNPVTDRLFSFRREGDHIVIATYADEEAASLFFRAQKLIEANG